METKPCRICKELEASRQAAQQPDPPALVLGLTEAGAAEPGSPEAGAARKNRESAGKA